MSQKRYNGGHETIVYSTETLDVGNGFNASTGIYTAPMTGNYAFSWTIRMDSSPVGIYLITEIVVNTTILDIAITHTDKDGTDHTTSTATTSTSLHKGDRVFVRVQRTSGGVVYIYIQTPMGTVHLQGGCSIKSTRFRH